MGKRCHSYFLFLFILFFSDSISANKNIIPPAVLKIPKRMKISLSSGPSTQITQQEISDSGMTSLTDVLQNLGGVQLQNTVGNNSQVLLNLRGFGASASSNSLLLINGIPITNPDIMPPDLNTIPLQEIKFIDVIAGSESVLYGDQAVGGIINIGTRESSKKNIGISCSAGSYDTKNCYLTLSHRYRDTDHRVAFSTQQTANYRDNNNDDQRLLTGTMRYHPPNNKFYFNYTLASEEMQYPGALTLAQARQNRRQATSNINYFQDQNGFFQLQHQYEWNSNWNMTTDFASRLMHGHGILTAAFKQLRQTFFVKPQLKGTWRNVVLTSGADAQSDHYHLASLFGVTEDQQQKYGLFSLASLSLHPNLLFSIGARGALQQSRTQSFALNRHINRALATTIGITYQLLPHIQFYLRRAESFRFPKADENASTPLGVNGLRTQRGIAYETGLQMDHEKDSAKINLFQLNLKDEIAFDPTQTPTQPFGSNTNYPPTSRYGLTLSGKKQITDLLSLNGQYQFINARFKNGIYAGNRIPLVAENFCLLSLNYQITEHWHTYTEALYTGSQYAANDNANMAGKNGGYTTYHVNLRYEQDYFSIAFHFNNIFNKYFNYYSIYQAPQEFVYPAAGRNFMLTGNLFF